MSAITRFKKLSSLGSKPTYATKYSAGADLTSIEDVTLMPGERKLVKTGIAVEFHESSSMLICPRSGLALNHGITILNSPGVVDADYRGEIKVMLMNFGNAPYKISIGDRIAQAVLVDVSQGTWLETDTLEDTSRGPCGFGSSGK